MKDMEIDTMLKQQYGNGNHFRVPEGYFEAFNARMMQLLPERESGPMLLGWHRYRLLLCAAASVCGLVFGVNVFLNHYENTPSPHVAKVHEAVAHDKQVDEMADFLMLDSDDMLSYMVNN